MSTKNVKNVNDVVSVLNDQFAAIAYIAVMVCVGLFGNSPDWPKQLGVVAHWFARIEFGLLVLSLSILLYIVWFCNAVVHGKVKAEPDVVHSMTQVHGTIFNISWSFWFWTVLLIPGSTYFAGYTHVAIGMWIVEAGAVAIQKLLKEPIRGKK